MIPREWKAFTKTLIPMPRKGPERKKPGEVLEGPGANC